MAAHFHHLRHKGGNTHDMFAKGLNILFFWPAAVAIWVIDWWDAR
jgi:hypothetical protein